MPLDSVTDGCSSGRAHHDAIPDCIDPVDFDGSYNRGGSSDSNAGLPNHNGRVVAQVRNRTKYRDWEGARHMNFRTGTHVENRSRPRLRVRRSEVSKAFGGSSGSGVRSFPCWLFAMLAARLAQGPDSRHECAGLPWFIRLAAWGRLPGGGVARSANLPGAGGNSGRSSRCSRPPRVVPTTVTTPGSGPGPRRCRCRFQRPRPQPVGPSLGAVRRAARNSWRTGGRRTCQRRDSRSRDRHHARPEPRPPRQVLRNPHGEGRHPPGQPAVKPSLLSRRSALAISRGQHAVQPGGAGRPSQVDTNITYPVDVSFKRQARTVVPARAERVLEAQYQDAVRNRIDDVYGAYVNALGARQTLFTQSKASMDRENLATLTRRAHDEVKSRWPT